MAAACELPALPALRLSLAASARLLHPPTADYAALATGLKVELRAVGAEVVVCTDNDPAALVGSGVLIVTGNLMDSAIVRRLYFSGYDFTDFAFPGAGGFTLRTIRDPFSIGAHVLLLGGSDMAGVLEAGRRLVARIRLEGLELGYLNEVRLGRWTTAEELEPAQFLADTDEVWQRVGASGSWEYMERIARCATGYLRTADECYLRLFRRELRHFMTHDVRAPNPEAPVMLHGRMYQLIMAWDLVQDHPLFSAEDRREFDAMFLQVARSPEGAEQIRAVAPTDAVRMNHDTRSALDAFFVGRYFSRRHGLGEAREWLELAERLFAPQLGSSKPVEDSWGHQWVASLHNTLVYALATEREDYLKSAAFRAAAERALLAHGAGGPCVYLANCAAATGDSGWLSLEPDGEDFVRRAAQLRLSVPLQPERPAYFEEVLRSFAVSGEIHRRADLLGVAVAPLDAFWHRTIESPVYNPAGIFAATATPETGFDKLTFREGWGADDFYLLLDGISGGHHAFQDANCLVRLREGGVEWFAPSAGYEHAPSVRAQNGMQVTLNGAGPGGIHRYARRLWQDTQGEYAACGTALAGLGETDWERFVLRRRGAWTLVLDRAVARAAGELLVERFWQPQGKCSLRMDGFDCPDEAAGGRMHFHLQSDVAAMGGEWRGPDPAERMRLAAEPGAALVLAGLIWVDERAGAVKFQLKRERDRWVINGGSGVEVSVELRGHELRVCTEAGQWKFSHGDPMPGTGGGSYAIQPLAVKAAVAGSLRPEWRIAEGPVSAVAGRPGQLVVGTGTGWVLALDDTGLVRWRTQLAGRILSLEFMGETVIAGEERGAVTHLDATGGRQWTVEIPWVTLPWAYWSESRSRILEIATADLDGDGGEEILVSNADRRVYAFDAGGRLRWKHAVEWGLFTAMWPALHEGRFALLAGTARPSIFGRVILLGADGRLRGHFTRPDLTCWSLPSGIRDLLRADLNGDGAIETLAAVDTNCRQVVAYSAAGAVLWDADVAAAAGAVAFSVAHRQVYAASDAGYVSAFAGADGRRRWTTWLGEAVSLLWVLPDESILAVAPTGRLWKLRPTGAVAEGQDMGEAFTAIPRPGNHRASGRRLLIGTASGRLLVW